MMEEILQKCLLSVIVFATCFPNGSGEKIQRRREK